MKCKICGSEDHLFDSATILNKYHIKYFECPYCGFIQTEEPYWLDEAYSSAITSSDIGLIQRNLSISRKLDFFFRLHLGGGGKFLDYGGGYGMLVRMMRDKGYDFEWYDKYCENLFAQHHEMSKQHYDVVTAFELLEHLPDPMGEIDKLFKMGDTVIFSTELIPKDRPKVKDWWYYGVEHGQHISFYTQQSMELIANKYGMKYSYMSGLHVFSRVIKRIHPLLMRLVRIPYSECLIGNRRPSLLPSDYEILTGKPL